MTYQPNCTEHLHVDATIILSFWKRYFHVSYRRWMPDTLAWQRQALVMHAKVARWRHFWIHYFSCLKFVLPNYCVKYYDYIVKWCSGLACNWCVSLDIVLIDDFRGACAVKGNGAVAGHVKRWRFRRIVVSRGNVDASLFHIKIRFFMGHQDQHGQNWGNISQFAM